MLSWYAPNAYEEVTVVDVPKPVNDWSENLEDKSLTVTVFSQEIHVTQVE